MFYSAHVPACSLGPINSCIPTPASTPDGKLPGMWDWVESAIYIGQKTILGMTLDVWATNYTAVSIYTDIKINDIYVCLH